MKTIELSTKSKAFLASISPIDDYGFQVRPWAYWLRESPQDELARLELNQACYREFINSGQRFPPDINKARMDEYHRIQEIKRLPA